MQNIIYGVLSGIITFVFFMTQGKLPYFKNDIYFALLCPILSICCNTYLIYYKSKKLWDSPIRISIGLVTFILSLGLLAPFISNIIDKFLNLIHNSSTEHASSIGLLYFVAMQLAFFVASILIYFINWARKRKTN